MQKPLTVWITKTVEHSQRDGNTRPACLLRNLYVGHAATVRTLRGTMDWCKIGKGVRGCILSLYLFNFYAEYIMWNAGLDESQAGIKIARRNINNCRYADDTILVVEIEEELKSLLKKMKEESEKVGLKLNIKKKLRSWHPVPSLHGKWKGKIGRRDRFYFPGLQNHCWGWLQPWN